jgi:hypothetical protein
MLGTNFTAPKFGGAPAAGMPWRSETFFYQKDPIVTDARRIVNQGRINPDTATVGQKYWASYQQGTKKLFTKDALVCDLRYTYLFINNVSSNSYSVNINLESVTF